MNSAEGLLQEIRAFIAEHGNDKRYEGALAELSQATQALQAVKPAVESPGERVAKEAGAEPDRPEAVAGRDVEKPARKGSPFGKGGFPPKGGDEEGRGTPGSRVAEKATAEVMEELRKRQKKGAAA